MRKPQYQPALATLTIEEREQLADWLRQGTYDTVLERVNKPRAEGGFDLHISISPLQTFYAKVALLDLINTKVPDDKKMTITQFESISAGEVLLASEKNSTLDIRTSDFHGVSSEVHSAIMEATHDLATSGDNTPTDLLALQRLADFPARAEYREHKRQFDLEKAAQKKEMDEHRKRMAEERLTLSQKAYELHKRSLDLREKALEARDVAKSNNSALCTPNSALEDDLGPLASTLDEIEARATRKFNLPPPDRSSRGPQFAQRTSHEGTLSSGGLGKPFKALEKARTAESQLKDTTTPAPEPTRPAASASSTPSAVSAPQCQIENAQCLTAQAVRPTCSSDFMLNESAPAPVDSHPSIDPPIHPSSLEQRVSAYTLARHYEAAHGKNPRIVGKYAAWNFKTKMQWCPCGNQSLPCPDHGDFPKYFWELSPDSADFTAVLRAKKLPFIPHYQLLREQEEEQRRQQEAAEQPIPLSSSLPPLPLSETLSETLSSSSQENTEDSRTNAELQSGDDNEKARIDQAISLTPEPSHEVARQSCCSDFQSGASTEVNETTASAVFEATDNEQPTSDQSNNLITDH